MKRKIFLSFRPEFFRPIFYDIKKYEYRKRFCKEATTAYLYLSSPCQKVIGIMELGVPIMTEEIINAHLDNSILKNRINHCIENGEKFAIPIESFRLFKNPIPISKLKEIDEKFSVPQCYLNIEKYKKIFEYINKQELYDNEFVNTHEDIYTNNFGMSCLEMEQTSEFKEKDKIYINDDKYNIVDCGYLTK
ncbi:MAG: hypothetical protein RRY16_02885 [Bacilli bacterium]